MSEDTLVCMRTEHGPAFAPSFVDHCEVCRRGVWRSVRSRGWLGRIVCMQCGGAELEADTTISVGPAPWVADDLDELR